MKIDELGVEDVLDGLFAIYRVEIVAAAVHIKVDFFVFGPRVTAKVRFAKHKHARATNWVKLVKSVVHDVQIALRRNMSHSDFELVFHFDSALYKCADQVCVPCHLSLQCAKTYIYIL